MDGVRTRAPLRLDVALVAASAAAYAAIALGWLAGRLAGAL